MDDKKNKKMQSIKYNGKTIKLPCDILYNDIEIVTQTNPYSNQSCELPKFARGVYCAIKNAEIDGNYKKMQKCITWFQKHFTSQYYTLLD
jgi:hypothetical protein|tara:strand:- start:202 stop:471 length:270 start_codon:yes stop_codon:yes gene_type:complete